MVVNHNLKQRQARQAALIRRRKAQMAKKAQMAGRQRIAKSAPESALARAIRMQSKGSGGGGCGCGK